MFPSSSKWAPVRRGLRVAPAGVPQTRMRLRMLLGHDPNTEGKNQIRPNPNKGPVVPKVDSIFGGMVPYRRSRPFLEKFALSTS